jgi:hypothetical protein
MSSIIDITAERIAKNDAAFRAANEQIRRRAAAEGKAQRIPFLCECAREDCTEIVWLTAGDYEAIRSSPTCFFNARGHERYGAPVVEVVREEEGYVVVEKQGRAAEVVEELDPRKED